MNYPRYFTATPDTWKGGYYELALELDSQITPPLYQAVSRLWHHPSLQGCYQDRYKEPWEQPCVQPEHLETPDELCCLYGVAQIPGDYGVACGSFCLLHDPANPWLVFYVPLGALSQFLPLAGYPFGTSKRDWQPGLDAWLASIGEYLFASVPFKLGLIGHEVAGDTTAADLSAIPPQRTTGYLWPKQGHLQYFPANIL